MLGIIISMHYLMQTNTISITILGVRNEAGKENEAD